MNIFYDIVFIDVLLIGLFYVIGHLAVKIESKDTWGDAETMEFRESRQLSDEWEKRHPILDFFQSFYYEIGRKTELPGDIYKNIKWFIQRGKRGYSDCDVWGFDYYLSKVIVNGLKSLQKQTHGTPCGMIGSQSINTDDKESKEMKEWKKILGEIIWSFEITQKIQDGRWILVSDERSRKNLEKFKVQLNTRTKDDDVLFKGMKQPKYHLMSKNEMKRYKNGWKLFQKYYFDLWD